MKTISPPLGFYQQPVRQGCYWITHQINFCSFSFFISSNMWSGLKHFFWITITKCTSIFSHDSTARYKSNHLLKQKHNIWNSDTFSHWGEPPDPNYIAPPTISMLPAPMIIWHGLTQSLYKPTVSFTVVVMKYGEVTVLNIWWDIRRLISSDVKRTESSVEV